MFYDFEKYISSYYLFSFTFIIILIVLALFLICKSVRYIFSKYGERYRFS